MIPENTQYRLGQPQGKADRELSKLTRDASPRLVLPTFFSRRIPVARQALPRVHGGFWEVYSKLREQVLATLAAEMEVSEAPRIVEART